MISIICAMGRNRAIGLSGKLLWNIPDDLDRFKKLTLGNSVIMGRKTYESIGKVLEGRNNIVISRDPDFSPDNCIVCRSIETALESAGPGAFVIGGEEIYRQTLEFADRLYLTIVDDEPDADTFFPEFENLFHPVREEHFQHGNLSYSFVELAK